jgi:hypothetical protein
MDNVQNLNYCINIPSSQPFRSYSHVEVPVGYVDRKCVILMRPVYTNLEIYAIHPVCT